MANVTVTAADVRPLTGAIVRRFDAGGTVTIGAAVYIASDGDVEHADADAAASARVVGIAVSTPDGGTSVSAGERVDVVVAGPVAGFTSLTPGGVMYNSVTAGSIADAASTVSGDYVWVVGYAEAASTVFVQPWTYDIAAVS